MKYTLTFNKKGRTTEYRGTVTSKTDPDLVALKRSVADHNANVRSSARRWNKVYNHQKLLRVTLMARGPRRVDGQRIHHNADSCLQHEYADHWDVYVHEDGSNTHELKRELDMGLTPSMLRKYDEFENEMFKLKVKGMMRKRELEQS